MERTKEPLAVFASALCPSITWSEHTLKKNTWQVSLRSELPRPIGC